jgi:cytochrome c biogenesis protein CcmG/thiol:disulfide interchange protein DsbE
MISKRGFLGLATVAGVASLGLGTAYAWKTGRIALGPVDLPDTELPGLAGLTQNGRAVPGYCLRKRGDNVALINFWASWCPYCRSEHEELMRLAQDPRLTMIGIATDDTERNVLRYLDEHGNPYHQLSMDHGRVVVRATRQRGIPTTLVVPSGQTRAAFRHIGPLNEAIVSASILPLLPQPLAEG